MVAAAVVDANVGATPLVDAGTVDVELAVVTGAAPDPGVCRAPEAIPEACFLSAAMRDASSCTLLMLLEV